MEVDGPSLPVLEVGQVLRLLYRLVPHAMALPLDAGVCACPNGHFHLR